MSMAEVLDKTEKSASSNSRKVLPGTLQARGTIAVPLTEFIVVSTTAYITSVVYHLLVYGSFFQSNIYIAFSLFLASLYFVICLATDQYNLLGEKWRRDGAKAGVGAIALAFTFFLSLIFVFDLQGSFSRGTIISQFGLVSAAVVITRVILTQNLERAIRAGKLRGRGIIIVSLAADFRIADYASKLCTASDRIVRFYQIPTSQVDKVKHSPLANFANVIRRIRIQCRESDVDLIIVVYDGPNQAVVENIVEAFYELPVQIRLMPMGMVPFMQRSQVVPTGQFSTLEISTQPFSLLDRFLKRTFDLTVAISAVLLFLPLLLLVAIAIKLDSPGTVLFRQIRHGFNNELIQVFKFRTMKTPKAKEQFRQATKGDPRITRVGRILRMTNIDELPQLFNVIRGNMSIVGPRPHATEHNEAFASQIKMIYRRHNVKPGITGWAQVNAFRGETDTCEKMQKRIEYDLYYIDNWSIFFDLRVLLMTILSRRAYTNAY
jgi:Undecaprenyl-phosphate glucose phosphotransferase